jgi:hypothetical protein
MVAVGGASPDASARPGLAGAGSTPPVSPSGDPAMGAINTNLNPPSPQAVPTQLGIAAVGMVAAITLLGAWAFIVLPTKRRRTGDIDAGPQPAIAAAAIAPALEPAVVAEPASVDESLMPRWRRPSLQRVRKNDPVRNVVEATSLSFAAAAVAPLADHERRRIAYRLVRLLDTPDEFRATEIGILDQGDEVQLLERQGVYWLVLCPDGRRGWIHRMTLADAAPQPAADESEPMPQYGFEDDEVVEPEPEVDEESSQESILDAYMKARNEMIQRGDYSQNGSLGGAIGKGDAYSPWSSYQRGDQSWS